MTAESVALTRPVTVADYRGRFKAMICPPHTEKVWKLSRKPF